MGAIRNVERQVFRRLRVSSPTSLLGRLAFWLLLIALVATAGRWLPGAAGVLFRWFSVVPVGALLFVLVPLLWRYTVGRFLWKVRNRLIVTYLLMGLAPVVLFLSLASIATYIFLGQFAVFAANAEFDRSLHELSAENLAYTHHLAHTIDARTYDPAAAQPLPEAVYERSPGRSRPHIAAFLDGRPIKLALDSEARDERVTRVPEWVPTHFHGIVFSEGQLYLRAVDTDRATGHVVSVISSVPLAEGITHVAQGLGRITIFPGAFGSSDDATPISSETSEARAVAILPNTIVGGRLPAPRNLLDVPVNFFVPLDTEDWAKGTAYESNVHITSRPTLLYGRLFITSLKVAAIVQNVLIAFTIFFGLLELGAFLMAVRLNQTITRSISDLYVATLAIDNRDFTHRIEVTRRDQLAALSGSFNAMTASLQGLLEEQREKERLLGELEIAQEVQANLYPSGNVSLPSLEVYGICQPARTVSGDYYDFLVSGNNELSLALGDISGKGISAALLMATLHSAVHAYRFAGDDMRRAGDGLSGVAVAVEDGPAPLLAASFSEPGQIMGLLNRHLFRSTQPEKYATLFLAHYNGHTAEMTYSTGGQPPPLLLRVDDSVVRMDCGGTVVGLLDNMRYEQGTVRLQVGDIVIAYSDGVTEPENEFGDFGEDRLVEIVRRNRRLPLEQIADQVLQSLRSWIGAEEQPDDITIVLARER